MQVKFDEKEASVCRKKKILQAVDEKSPSLENKKQNMSYHFIKKDLVLEIKEKTDRHVVVSVYIFYFLKKIIKFDLL